MKVPFVDLKLQYKNYKAELDEAISAVISETAFVGGGNNKFVTKFENEFASFLGQKHVVSCANGTDSIEILLEAFGIGEQDEVIVPALSWISTSEAVGRIGAKPVFVDIDENTLLIDVNKIEEKITKQTKAIIPVHLYGNAVNMEFIMTLATKHNFIVIEDCAQSHGSKYNGKLTGTFGHASSFSFYPGKNLGAYGDAGAISTNSDEIASKCRMIANHGQLKKHDHVMEGRNSRLDGIHASILSAKLKHLNSWNALRVSASEKYNEHLKNYIQFPVINTNSSHVFHLYVIRTDKRDELKQYLESNQIETAIHYPTPLPLLKAYSKFGFAEDDFPIASKQTKRILSIPMFPEITKDQISYVSGMIASFFDKQ
jgi:dTDP-4-amino-4,6-dideoxygalactose transaminase